MSVKGMLNELKRLAAARIEQGEGGVAILSMEEFRALPLPDRIKFVLELTQTGCRRPRTPEEREKLEAWRRHGMEVWNPDRAAASVPLPTAL